MLVKVYNVIKMLISMDALQKESIGPVKVGDEDTFIVTAKD